ncbi:hypothetical protein [Alteromonas sp. a30]|uniref:hypothetical protein n=1 Tax=Alteromonas sp. a30 TaxID=2730917 RepID=UPI00227E663A|nr:hypothetical protein [Alteromonas sp. a30]MCY7293800.1 hypothetical protein [Alteromonas sp. a30]
MNNKHAIQYVKQLKDSCGGYRDFFIKLYGREPSKQDVQSLINAVNRGKYNMDFILRLVAAFDLDNVTFGEFYKGQQK